MPQSHTPLACNMMALTPAQRERHAILKNSLATAVLSHREIRDGYLFAIDTGAVSRPDIHEWMDLEIKCCPFFRLGVRKAAGRWNLRIRGPEVKSVIRHEFPEFFRSNPAIGL
jgi:hypothetical protein